jgi:hypothetical protein
MPYHPWQTNFTSGEVSPMLLARTDLEKYANSAACLENFVVSQHGGAFRRAGTVYVAHAGHTEGVRLHPFIFNQTEAYVLEFGPGYVRIFANRQPLRFPTTSPNMTLTLSAGVGDITVTTSAAFFTDAATDGTREITLNDGGLMVIFDVASPTSASARMLIDTETTTFTSGQWTITGARVELATPYAYDDLFALRFAQSADTLYVCHPEHPVRKIVRQGVSDWVTSEVNFQPPPSTDAGLQPFGDLVLGATTGFGITATSSAPAWIDGDLNKYIQAGAGRASIRTVVSSTEVVLDIIDPFTTDTWAQGSWTMYGVPYATATPSGNLPKFSSLSVSTDVAAFRSTDLFRFIHINGGIFRIGEVLSPTLVNATVIRKQDVDEGEDLEAPPGSWTLESEAWSNNLGFPGVVCFHDQRLFLAASANQPLTFWGSVTGDFENFAVGADASDAVEFNVAADQVNAIRWMKSETFLMIGTQNNEFKAWGGNESAITPSSILVESLGATGSDWYIDPVRVGNRIVFVQRAGRKVRELAYSYEQDRYIAPDISLMSEHLFRNRLAQLEYVRTPDPYILATSIDGTLLVCAYNREENIVAWTPLRTREGDGFESIAVIPNACGTADEVWVSVKRTINGGTTRTIEFLEAGLTLDCASMYTGAETNVLRGLSYLENEQVVVAIVNTAGDIFIEEPTVTAGQITLTHSGSTIFVGFGFPLNLKTLRLELQGSTGSQQTRKGKIHGAGIRFFCSQYALVNGQEVEGMPGFNVGLFTGDKYREGIMGWDNKNQLIISLPANIPLRCNVLGIAPLFSPSEP